MCQPNTIRAKATIMQGVRGFPLCELRMIIFRAEMCEQQYLGGAVVLLANKLRNSGV
jgi:hypothetical protein